MNTKIKKFSENLYLITLTPPISGFDNFIGTWLYKGQKTFIVDVGPAVTANYLVETLQNLNVFNLDYIFLTHIHIDHAGSIGNIAKHFPDTPIICHKSGIPHLVDPARLWEGTIKTLGDTGRAYGPMEPVPPNRLLDAQQFISDLVLPVMTPGHASHHVSYLTREYLFAGEAGGVFFSLGSNHEYLRPATPPPFFLETFINSIDALIAKKPAVICYGHFGLVENGMEMLKKHSSQLLLWKKIIDEEMKKFKGKNFVDVCLNRLLKDDPCLEGFFHMDEDVKKRERYFLTNSLKGFAKYLDRTFELSPSP